MVENKYSNLKLHPNEKIVKVWAGTQNNYV